MKVPLPKEMQSDDEDEVKYKYLPNNWLTSIIVFAIWLFVLALNIYAIVDMAKNGVAGS